VPPTWRLPLLPPNYLRALYLRERVWQEAFFELYGALREGVAVVNAWGEGGVGLEALLRPLLAAEALAYAESGGGKGGGKGLGVGGSAFLGY
jgi:hypothetical protein